MSGAKIEAVKVLKKASKHEFHHIYPQKYLETLSVDERRINSLANICFLTRADNNKIKARGPAQYISEMEPTTKAQYLNEAFCPTNIESLDYDDFLKRRELLLLSQADALTGALAGVTS